MGGEILLERTTCLECPPWGLAPESPTGGCRETCYEDGVKAVVEESSSGGSWQ